MGHQRQSYRWARDAFWVSGRRSCHYCGLALTLKRRQPNSMTTDHIVPRAAGGEERLHNLVPACPQCNSAKGSMSEAEFRAKMADGTAFLPGPKKLAKRAAFAEQMERARRMRIAIGLERADADTTALTQRRTGT